MAKQQPRKRKARGKQPRPRIRLDLDLGPLAEEEDQETRQVIEDWVTSAVQGGLIPFTMVPLVEDILQWRIQGLLAEPSSDLGLPPESIARILELTNPVHATRYIAPTTSSALVSLETGEYLDGGYGPVLFEVPDLPASGNLLEISDRQEASTSELLDFIRENQGTLAIELMIEVLTIILILVPGGSGAKKVAEEVGAKAAKNRRIRNAVIKLIEDLLNYGTRGKGADKLRRNLQELFKALTEADLFQDAMAAYLSKLSGWQIFWLVLDILLAFTPVGWAKKGAELGLALGGLTYHVHHKHAEWKKHKGKQT